MPTLHTTRLWFTAALWGLNLFPKMYLWGLSRSGPVGSSTVDETDSSPLRPSEVDSSPLHPSTSKSQAVESLDLSPLVRHSTILSTKVDYSSDQDLSPQAQQLTVPMDRITKRWLNGLATERRIGTQTLTEAAHYLPRQGPFRIEDARLPLPPNCRGNAKLPPCC